MSISIIGKTISGQPDPTAGKALGKLIGEERKEQRLAEKMVEEICGQKKHSTATRPHKNESGDWTCASLSSGDPNRDLVFAAIAAAYRDYVNVLRLLEEIPEPGPEATKKDWKKHNKRIDKLKEEMEEIEEFFYSPMYALACDLNPDILVDRAWKEAYHDS